MHNTVDKFSIGDAGAGSVDGNSAANVAANVAANSAAKSAANMAAKTTAKTAANSAGHGAERSARMPSARALLGWAMVVLVAFMSYYVHVLHVHL